MYGGFTRFGGENIAFYANDVAEIGKVFPHFIVHRLVFTGADLVAFYINLNFSGAVLDNGKEALPISRMLMIRPARHTSAKSALFSSPL